MAKILIVEDHFETAENLQDWLKTKLFVVDVVNCGEEALAYIETNTYDLILLDLNLPEMHGFDILKKYRDSGGDAAVIITSALSSVQEKEAGLDLGADDYMVKPYNLRELSARVRAVLRRPQKQETRVIETANLKLDPISGFLEYKENNCWLQKQESLILELLMKNTRQLFSIEDLLRKAWSTESETTHETVRVQILKLRKKLEALGIANAIHNLRGKGYYFQVQ